VGIADDIKGEVPAAFVVPKPEKDVSELKEKVIAAIRRQIGPIAAPHKVFIVPDLPKTRSGKIIRRLLRKIITGENPGDLSTLVNPESVESIKTAVADGK